MEINANCAATDERARLAELHGLQILDTPAEERFDQYTRLVADVLEVPTAVISLVDADRQWFKSKIGTDATQIPRAVSFCAHALPVDYLEVPDARADARFKDNPLVTGEPFIRFYAGAVLRGPTGCPLGTLCIVDRAPRRLATKQKARLLAFAGLVEQEINRNQRYKRLASDLHGSTFYDPVTGLPERGAMQAQLTRSLAAASENRRAVAVVYLQLANFETLAELEGQAGCDIVMHMLARRLQQRVRPTDHVGRVESDRFVVIMPGLEACTETAERIRALVGQVASQVTIGGIARPVKLAAGVARYPEDASCAATLLDCARSALRYFAGGDAAGVCHFYSRETHDAVSRRHDLMHRLSNALRNDTLIQLYQPIVACDSGRIVAVEALARWNDPAYGPISPAEFIPLSEADPEMRRALTRWSLVSACRQIVAWRKQGLPALAVSVNIPGGELYRHDFMDLIRSILAEYGVASQQLVLELTEASLITHIDIAVATISALRATGVRFAVDDFGTGYSSLNYLKQLPLDTVKIDRSFVRDIAIDDTTRELTRGMLDIARTLNLSVVAEGIETADQHAALKQMHCGYLQGFLFSRPATATAISGQLRAA